MRRFKFLSGIAAGLLAVSIFLAGLPISQVQAAQSGTYDALKGWKNEIESMLSEREYAEGEVLALVDNTMRKQLTVVEETEEVEKLTDVSENAMEETFETELNVPKRKADEAAQISLITSETKTTRELLYELADDPSVIYAAPNYISPEDDWEEDLAAEDAGHALSAEDLTEQEELDEAGLTETALNGAGATGTGDEKTESAVKQILFFGADEDLIEKQGYETIGDLSYLQWGYGTRTDNLLTLNSPSWNTKNGANVDTENPPVVAVIDSGIDYTHPDFRDMMVDDMSKYSDLGGPLGYNSSGHDAENDPMDDNGHGSHCAGIIASKWDGIGTSGVVSGVKLCIVRTSVNGGFYDDAVIKAFKYLSGAVDRGLNLVSVNCSFGGDGFSNLQLLMINELGQKGVVICVASGNSSYDNDEYPNTSADYSPSPYVIGVDASTATYRPSDYTSYGQTTSDVFSPGDSILSPVCKEAATYMASIDNERSFFETFDDDELGVKVSYVGKFDTEDPEDEIDYKTDESFMKFVDEAVQAGTIVTTESYDQEGHSLKLDVPALGSKKERAVFLVSVPANLDENGNITESTRYSFAVKSTLGRTITWAKMFGCGFNGGANISFSDTSGWLRPSQVWTNHTVSPNISKESSKAMPNPYYKGRLYFAIIVEDYDGTNTESELYLDCIGSGKRILRYAFFQGTSMATPAIAGATAVMYDKLSKAGKLDGLNPSEKAIFVANTMKASVVYNNNYDKRCTSNGAFDFNVEEKDYTPVINTAIQNDKTYTLTGQFFGSSKGSVTIDDNACKVTSWSDKEIKFTLPDSIKNERHSLVLTAKNGKAATRKIVVTGIEDSKREVFEHKVKLPKEIENCQISAMTGIDGVLYVVPQTINTDKGAAPALVHDELWSYDPDTDTWKKCTNIPIAVESYDTNKSQYTSIDNYEDLVVVLSDYIKRKEDSAGTKEPKERENLDEIFFYNPETDTWTKADLSGVDLPKQGTIFATDDGVFFTGGFVIEEKTDPETKEKSQERKGIYKIYKLGFDLDAVKNGAATVAITSATEVGVTDKHYESAITAGRNGDQVVLFSQQIEWLKWNEETQKFTSEKCYSFMDTIGTKEATVCFIPQHTAALTPDGVLVVAYNGDEYSKRGYDTFWFDQNETETPFEKNAAFGDLYAPLATYTNGYVYVWGDSFYNNDETLGYLAYTQLEKYEILEGDNGKWIIGSEGSVTVRGSGEFSKFLKVKIDNKVVLRKNYDVKEGSTVITFKKEYLDTLSVGVHDLEIFWEHGSAKGKLTVEKPDIPQTGDNSMATWFIFLIAAIILLGAILAFKKKCRN